MAIPRSRPFAALALALTTSCLVACSKTPPETNSSSSAAPVAPPATPAAASTSTTTPHSMTMGQPSGSLLWTDPPSWKRRPPSSSMRKAEYGVPHAAADTEDGECSVITFGQGQGGGVEQNIDRWKGQFDAPTESKTATSDVNGMHVTTLSIAGTFKGGGMPGAAPTAPKSGSRMIASVVEAPDGMWFFKLTGPDATVKAATDAFNAMIASMHPM